MPGTLVVPVISLKGEFKQSFGFITTDTHSDFESRKEEIIQKLLEASETIGFFSLVDHGITIDEINAQFELSKKYFDLPPEVKGRIPHAIETNNGWEYKVRHAYPQRNEKQLMSRLSSRKYVLRPE